MANQRDQEGSVTRKGITLTAREMDVLRATAEGLKTNQIASRLQLPPDRVKKHRGRIKLLIGLGEGANPQDMVERARALGFVE